MQVLYWSGIALCLVGTFGIVRAWIRSSTEAKGFTHILRAGAFCLGLALSVGYVRAWKAGIMPFSGAEDSFALLGFALIIAALYLARLPRFLGLCGVLGGTGVLSAISAVFLPERTLPTLSLGNALVFSAHVLVLFLAIASFVIAFVSGLFYLLAQRDLKHKRFSQWLRLLPSLEALDRVAIRSVILGAVALSLGMISGIYLAHSVWATNWISDPKFILTTLTWAWYVLLLVFRGVFGWRGARFFFFMVVGFFLLMVTFWGTAVLFVSRDASYAIREVWRFAWIWS